MRYVSSKLMVGAIVILISVGGGWYITHLLEERGRLESALQQASLEIEEKNMIIEREREQFQNTIANYDEVMSEYVNQLADNQQSSQRLRQTISRLSVENERLGQCLREDVPQELIDKLWEGQQ